METKGIASADGTVSDLLQKLIVIIIVRYSIFWSRASEFQAWNIVNVQPNSQVLGNSQECLS
jgi:hypothetical protein